MPIVSRRRGYATKVVGGGSKRKKKARKSKKKSTTTMPKPRGPCKYIYKYVDYTMPRLRKIAKRNKLKGYSGLDKAQLIQLINEHKRVARKTRPTFSVEF